MGNSRDVADVATTIMSNHEDMGCVVNKDSVEQLLSVNGQIAPSNAQSTPPVTWNVAKCSSQQNSDCCVYHDELPCTTWAAHSLPMFVACGRGL